MQKADYDGNSAGNDAADIGDKVQHEQDDPANEDKIHAKQEHEQHPDYCRSEANQRLGKQIALYLSLDIQNGIHRSLLLFGRENLFEPFHELIIRTHDKHQKYHDEKEIPDDVHGGRHHIRERF